MFGCLGAIVDFYDYVLTAYARKVFLEMPEEVLFFGQPRYIGISIMGHPIEDSWVCSIT